jgi:hypothetical protein
VEINTNDQQRPPDAHPPLSAPFRLADWAFQWIAYWASNIAFFRVLEYAGRLAILIAAIFWIIEIPERREAAIRSAWSVVNAKGGGRKEALEFLVSKNVDLKGLDGASAYFAKIKLSGADLSWSNLQEANFAGANLRQVNFE